MTDHPIQMLKEEHRSIERILHVLAGFCRQAENGQAVSGAALDQVLEFISVFADKGHHGKEEQHLFPLLEQRGMPREGGPIAVMLAEHDEGRRLIHRIRSAVKSGEPGGTFMGEELVEPARRYIDLLQAHIEKEEKVLFPMATNILDEGDFSSLEASFRAVNQEMGTGAHEGYQRLAVRLESDSAT